MMSSAAKKALLQHFRDDLQVFSRIIFFAYNNEYSLFDNAFDILEAKSLDDLHNHLLGTLSRIEKLVNTADFNSLVKSALLYMERNFSKSKPFHCGYCHRVQRQRELSLRYV
ncbi:MAG: hypothetical protein L6V93_20020 [Clostridiales bacterium]|nr:MAG: hypothetical protein L6V93_20020 [Clostridiales bacterium]